MSEKKTKLEQEFAAAYDKANDLIAEQMKVAHQALTNAQKIAEEYGVPFDASISPISQIYTPASFSEKFESLREFVCDEYGIYPYEYDGWEHSAVC